MTSDNNLRKVLRMLGQAVYSWGVNLLDDDATDGRGVLDSKYKAVAQLVRWLISSKNFQ